jgi:hypothetical protein
MIEYTCDKCGKKAQPEEIRLAVLTDLLVAVNMSDIPVFRNLCESAIKFIIERIQRMEPLHIKTMPLMPKGWAGTFENSKYWVCCSMECMRELSEMFDIIKGQELN